MPLLRMREATFARGEACAGPVTVDLREGERVALHFASPSEAAIVAFMAAGITKASGGCVLLDDYDPRIQSAACKRIAALVPHEPFALTDGEFARYIDYRAALWNVDAKQARSRAARLRRDLAGMHEALAYPLIGALVPNPKLLVIDRPQPAYAGQILAVTGGCALLSTHSDAASARAFGPNAIHFLRAVRA